MGFEEVFESWAADPAGFWAEAATKLSWAREWDTVLDTSDNPAGLWFKGGQINTCFNALDRHVENGRADQAALIYDSPVTGSACRYSYRELLEAVALFGGALNDLGVARGDRVIIYMPMVPEAVIAMLACARIGAVHSVVFGGFAAHELAKRIDDAQPKVVLSASCGIEPNRLVEYKPLLDEAIRLARHRPERSVILQRPEHAARLDAKRDLDWHEALDGTHPVPCTPVAATDPLYILYTSGTTGEPKGIVRDNGGHAVALYWSMKHIYGVEPGEVFWAASDIGWVVGHSYIVYAPLLHGNTTILYEGKPVGTPDPGAFWRVIDEHDVKVLFTAPTAFRAIKKEDPSGSYLQAYPMDKFRALFLAGERCDPDTLAWAEQSLEVPVIDHWWQTETGWSIAANCLGIEHLPVKPGSPTRAVPGYRVEILGDQGQPQKAGEIGAIVIRLPLPPGNLPTLWKADARFREAYLDRYDGYYLTGDAGYIDEDQYLWIMSRIDDVINVAGHRLSTGALEEVLAAHPQVAECAVFGVNDRLKGELPVGLVVLNADANIEEETLRPELILAIRQQIGPVAAFKHVSSVPRLPKTRSGKILRGTMKKIADGDPWDMPATIDDPETLNEIEAALKALGFG